MSSKGFLGEKNGFIKKTTLLKKEQIFVLPENQTCSFSSLHIKKYYQQVLETENLTEEERSKKLVEESSKTVSKQRSKKSRWLSTGFMLFNLALVIGIFTWSFLNEQPASISELFAHKINWVWLCVCVLLFFLINCADSSRNFTLIFHATKKARPFLSYKSTALCRFYDSITPLATGGQPFQIYYLNQRGLPSGIATSVPLGKYLYSQFLTMLFIAIVLICQRAYIISLNPYILTLCYIGFALNILLIGSILWLSLSKKVAPSFAIGILKLLSKMRLVKDYRRSFVKVIHTVRDYASTMKKFLSNAWIALTMVLTSGVCFVLNYSIPFAVYATFMPLDGNWFEMYVKLLTIAVVCDMACSFFPIPGASGMAEISFAVLFGTFFSEAGESSIFVWALLLWRILTYYGYLLQGLGVMLYDFLHGNKKAERRRLAEMEQMERGASKIKGGIKK